jgi:hypothetical protein
MFEARVEMLCRLKSRRSKPLSRAANSWAPVHLRLGGVALRVVSHETFW